MANNQENKNELAAEEVQQQISEEIEKGPEPKEFMAASRDGQRFIKNLYVDKIFNWVTKGLYGLLTDTQKTDLTDGGATTLHSHAIGGVPGTLVFDEDAPTSYTNLDLSSVVGSKVALVYIRVLNDSVNANQYRFQTNGEASTVSSSIGLGGVTMADPPQTEINYVFVLTDSSGIIEWKADSAFATKLTVLAYIILT